MLWQATSRLFLLAIPCKMLSDAAQFTAPVFMGLLLNAVSAGEPDAVGYSLAFGMLAGLLVGTLADNQQFQFSMRAGGCGHRVEGEGVGLKEGRANHRIPSFPRLHSVLPALPTIATTHARASTKELAHVQACPLTRLQLHLLQASRCGPC